ncbi:MAG TPA: ATP-dependent DNA ligase, partial [Actinomycetes bacterium]|nr:ATP-dependent DNA ligase [Actinomycetes bacterium]
MAAAIDSSIVVEGHSIRVTHPGRVLYPSEGVTKAQVITYYVRVAARLLPHVRRRPVTRIRWPNGVADESFYERNLPTHAPEWIDRVTIDHSDGPVTYPLITGASTLAWLAQHSALELHVPQWRLHGGGQRTDRIVFDLDPGPNVSIVECASVAFWLHEQLAADGMASVPVTSGSKGIHVYAHWKSSSRSSSPSEYAKRLAVAAQS